MASGDRPNTDPSKSTGDESPSSPLKKPQAKKAKVGSSRKMTQKEQSERFIAAAQEVGACQCEDAFERAVEIVLPEKKRIQP